MMARWKAHIGKLILLAVLTLSLCTILTLTNTQDHVSQDTANVAKEQPQPDDPVGVSKPPAIELHSSASLASRAPKGDKQIQDNTSPKAQNTQSASSTGYTPRPKEELARMTRDELFEAFSSASRDSYLELMGECIRRKYDGRMTDQEYSQSLYIKAKRLSEWGEYSFSGTDLHVSVLCGIQKYDEAVALLEEEIRIVKEGKLKWEIYVDGTKVNSMWSRAAVVRDIKKRIKEVRKKEKNFSQ